MFWDTYVMNAGVKLAEKHLGSQGRYNDVSDLRYVGVGLFTKEAGKFWYGDINFPTELPKLVEIAKGLKETLYIIPEWDSENELPLSERALAEIEAKIA